MSHVVSLTVLNKTAPPGSNPFEDDEDEEDEEETALEQQTVVNHISATKEEIKMLVKRRKKKRSIPSHVQPSCLLCFPIFTTCWGFFPSLFLRLFCIPASFLRLQVAGVCVDLHGHWTVSAHRQKHVCLDHPCNSTMSCRTPHVMRMGTHVSAVGLYILICISEQSVLIYTC